MQHIANMHQLRFLSLEGTQITDEGLLLLKGKLISFHQYTNQNIPTFL